MSYPKKHPTELLSPSQQRYVDKSHKKEQLKTLIVNKFRTKFGVKSTLDDPFDLVIRQEVDNVIAQENNQMTEASLVQLDKKLT
jgi:hypothetical protein